MKKCIIIFLFSYFFLNAIALPIQAQGLSNGTAIGVTIKDKNVKDGDIVSADKDGYKRTVSPYDPQIFGVVSKLPAVYLSDSASPTDLPIISVGQVRVNVSSQNGPIQKGDFITSSEVPGVGQKATENGFVIGSADEGYSNKDPKKVGIISVTLHPHFAQVSKDITRNLMNTFNLGMTAALETPSGLVRYIVSGTIALLSFFFGFRFFARASNRGVEAIGRNPLAKQAILLSVFINTVITISIMFFGVAIAYLILVL